MIGREGGVITGMGAWSRAGLLALTLLVVAAGGCGDQGLTPRKQGEAARAILDGTALSGTQDHGVVWVITPSAEQGFINLCTGTLITKRLVLTAAHCLEHNYVKGGERVLFGPQPDRRNDPGVKVIHVERNPGFSGVDTGIFANDVALLLLEHDAPPEATPWQVIPSALAAQLAGMDGRVVGYGIYNAADDIGRKHAGPVIITAVGESTVKIDPNPTRYCSGDSGGPLFATVSGTEYVVGVISTSSIGCSGENSTLTRPDAFWASFIEPFENRLASASRTLGERCYFDGNCSQGSCTSSEARENVKYCSKSCTADSDCTEGMLCRGAVGQKMCHYPRVHPEVLTGLCQENAACQTDRCSRFGAGGVKTCTIECTPSEQNPCPSGYACLSDLTNGGSACLKSSTPPPGGGGGGCSTASHAAGSGLALLLGLVLLLGLRRRRSGTG